jgi:hypothetical protein
MGRELVNQPTISERCVAFLWKVRHYYVGISGRVTVTTFAGRSRSAPSLASFPGDAEICVVDG